MVVVVVVIEKVVVAGMSVMAVLIMMEVVADMMVMVVGMTGLVITGLFRGASSPHASHVKVPRDNSSSRTCSCSCSCSCSHCSCSCSYRVTGADRSSSLLQWSDARLEESEVITSGAFTYRMTDCDSWMASQAEGGPEQGSHRFRLLRPESDSIRFS